MRRTLFKATIEPGRLTRIYPSTGQPGRVIETSGHILQWLEKQTAPVRTRSVRRTNRVVFRLTDIQASAFARDFF